MTIRKAVIVAVLALLPSVAAAQLELTPSIGMYFPVGAFAGKRHIASGTVGVRIASSHLDVGAAYSASPVAAFAAGRLSDIPARVVFISARAALVLGQVRLGAGPAVIIRGGSAWGRNRTTGVAAFSAAVRTPMTPRTAFLFELNDYVTTRHDLVCTMGIAWRLRGVNPQ